MQHGESREGRGWIVVVVVGVAAMVGRAVQRESYEQYPCRYVDK